MRRRRVRLPAAAAALVVLAVLVPVGRHERNRDVAAQNHGMERVRAAIGPLGGPSLYGYRVLPDFDCLVYKRGANPLALELCFDGAGRVVEAVDRRGGVRRYYSLHGEAAAARITVSRREADRLLREMGAV